jgi:hypothetical protein
MHLPFLAACHRLDLVLPSKNEIGKDIQYRSVRASYSLQFIVPGE